MNFRPVFRSVLIYDPQPSDPFSSSTTVCCDLDQRR
jgi:hypothetical protein